jgi:hypothetical protein
VACGGRKTECRLVTIWNLPPCPKAISAARPHRAGALPHRIPKRRTARSGSTGNVHRRDSAGHGFRLLRLKAAPPCRPPSRHCFALPKLRGAIFLKTATAALGTGSDRPAAGRGRGQTVSTLRALGRKHRRRRAMRPATARCYSDIER